jgi:hypothetical protein
MTSKPKPTRLRVSYVPAGPPEAGANKFEFVDHINHQIYIWPASDPVGVVVLKQGPSRWAG